MDNSTDRPEWGPGSEAPATGAWAAACRPQLDDECPWTASAHTARYDTPPPAGAARLLGDAIDELAEHERTATELMNLLRRTG